MIAAIPERGPCGFRSFDVSIFVLGGEGIREKTLGSFSPDLTASASIRSNRPDAR
jgi:hypothetical protein